MGVEDGMFDFAARVGDFQILWPDWLLLSRFISSLRKNDPTTRPDRNAFDL